MNKREDIFQCYVIREEGELVYKRRWVDFYKKKKLCCKIYCDGFVVLAQTRKRKLKSNDKRRMDGHEIQNEKTHEVSVFRSKQHKKANKRTHTFKTKRRRLALTTTATSAWRLRSLQKKHIDRQRRKRRRKQAKNHFKAKSNPPHTHIHT